MHFSIHSARIVLLALFSFLMLGPGNPAAFARAPGHKHQHGQWKQQIEALEQQWRSAMLTNDLQQLDKLLSDDYVGISLFGQISTKSMQMDRLRSSKLSITRLDLSDVKVKLLGRVAIVTSLADVAGTSDGNPIAGRFRYTRVYQRVSSGAWKITNFEATRLTGHDRKQDSSRGGSRLPGVPWIRSRLMVCYS